MRIPKIAGLEEPEAGLKTEVVVILKSDHSPDDLLEAAGLARLTCFYHQARLDQPDPHVGLKKTIMLIFEKTKRCYGYRRVLGDLCNQGRKVNHKLVCKLMD